jgi:hypothetical protein
MPEPVFSTVQVATLFGLAPTSSYFVVQRWIVPGLLEARRVDPKPDQDPRGIRYIVEPRAVLAFVRQHPDAYDWTKIADPLLKADAERVERRDPLVPLEEVLPSLGQPRPPYADRRCPRCKTQRTISQALDGYELACMNCGETEPIVDQAAEARREAKRQAEAAQLAAESRGPGRPKAVAS